MKKIFTFVTILAMSLMVVSCKNSGNENNAEPQGEQIECPADSCKTECTGDCANCEKQCCKEEGKCCKEEGECKKDGECCKEEHKCCKADSCKAECEKACDKCPEK